jgi:S-adenosylmethionine-diacylgycerolhomoserine-N-methlytransferase
MANLEHYYKHHSVVYDLTRWAFLFGRNEILQWMKDRASPVKILEIGCGTGYNLLLMARLFPGADLTGLDISGEMLKIAKKKLFRQGVEATLLQQSYDSPLENHYDFILFSYSLSMMAQHREKVLHYSSLDLSPGGHIGIVDFLHSPSPLFRKWLAFHSVALYQDWREKLEEHFDTGTMKVSRAYLGLWSYYLYLGSRKAK